MVIGNNFLWHINKPLRNDLKLYSQWTKFQWHSCSRMAWHHKISEVYWIWTRV